MIKEKEAFGLKGNGASRLKNLLPLLQFFHIHVGLQSGKVDDG